MAQIESGIRKVLAHPAVYDFFQDLVGVSRVRERWVREYLKPFPGARILDIGCGTSELLRYLPRGIEYTGYDRSEAYIAAARKRFGDRGRFTCESVEVEAAAGADGSAGRGSFDIALAFGVLHHLDDAEARQVFVSARRALKPAGRLVTIDPTFVPTQSRMSRYIVARDRGRNVRSPQAYAELGRGVFGVFETAHWSGALRIPFDHGLVVASGEP